MRLSKAEAGDGGVAAGEVQRDRFGFAPDASVVIGDHLADLGMGRAIGATTILVRTGHGAEAEPKTGALADHVADDLADAVTIIAALVGRDQ